MMVKYALPFPMKTTRIGTLNRCARLDSAKEPQLIETNRALTLQRAKEFYAEHKEEVHQREVAYDRWYKETYREEIKKRAMARYYAKHDLMIQRCREYRAQNAEYLSKKSKDPWQNDEEYRERKKAVNLASYARHAEERRAAFNEKYANGGGKEQKRKRDAKKRFQTKTGVKILALLEAIAKEKE